MTHILARLPQPYVSFHLDQTQARARSWEQASRSHVLFGGLLQDPGRSADPQKAATEGSSDSYSWADATVSKHAWIVELQVGFTSNTGTTELKTVRVLVDTGASHFKINSALGVALSQHWGVPLAPPGTDFSALAAPENCPPPGFSLDGLGVRFVAGGTEFTVAASNLLFQEDGRVVCNRIAPSDTMGGAARCHRGPDGDHDCVFGNAFLAGLQAVAFDYEQSRIGFLGRV